MSKLVLFTSFDIKIGRDRFQIHGELTDCDVTREKLFVNTRNGRKKGTNCCPDAFNRIGMDFVKTITVCVSRPLAIFMKKRSHGSAQ